MKRVFLGTTALVGASLLAGTALAKPEVRIGGFVDFQVGVVSQDRDGYGPSPGGVFATNPDRGYDVVMDSEVTIRASDKLDNGLAWAIKIELESNTDDGSLGTIGGTPERFTSNSDAVMADEVTITLTDSWGQLYLGSDDGPGDTMRVNGARAVANAGAGGTGGDWRRWVNWTTASSRFYSSPSEDFARDSSDANKIAYVTPRFYGFQAGFSFSPDRNSDGRYRDPDNNGTEENFWELGLNYNQKFDQVTLSVGATAGLASAENRQQEDTRTWSLGAMVGFGGFKVGAGYGSDGDSRRPKGASNTDLTGWVVGIGYTMGAWDFGLAYYRGEVGVENGSGENELNVVTLGATYTLGSGLAVYAEGVWFDTDSGTNNTTSFDNEGLALITGITVTF